MLTKEQFETLEEIITNIQFGYGWVAEDMMQIYADDDNLHWPDVEEYLNKHYPSYEIADMTVWSMTGKTREVIEEECRRDGLLD